MAPPEPKDKTEEEILERIAELYGRLEDVREQRKEEATSTHNTDGPRVVRLRRGRHILHVTAPWSANAPTPSRRGRGREKGSRSSKSDAFSASPRRASCRDREILFHL